MWKKIACSVGATTGAAIVGSYLYTKLIKKRSYKSFLKEKFNHVSRGKQYFIKPKKIDQMLKMAQIENSKPFKATKYRFNHRVDIREYYGTHTYYVNHQNDPHQLKILYMHGGSWVAGPFKEHYQMMDQLATDYNAEVIAPIYPKVPQSGKRATFDLMTHIYRNLLDSVSSSDQIIIMGDSAGGNIALSYAQYLNEINLPQPGHIITISPVVDATFTNPEIPHYEKVDSMIGKEGLKTFAKIWAESDELDNYKVSPINGDFNNLGHITLSVGTHELLYPDVIKLSRKLNSEGISHNLLIGSHMLHDYAIQNIPEAKQFRENLRYIINDNRKIKDNII